MSTQAQSTVLVWGNEWHWNEHSCDCGQGHGNAKDGIHYCINAGAVAGVGADLDIELDRLVGILNVLWTGLSTHILSPTSSPFSRSPSC